MSRLSNKHTLFTNWINSNAFQGLLPESVKLKRYDPTFYVAKGQENNPLCLFELSEDMHQVHDQSESFLETIARTGMLRLPAYSVFYTPKIRGKEIESFRVNRLMPRNASLGVLDPEKFARFIGSVLG